MKIIAGVEQPTDGEILLDGKPVSLPDTAALRGSVSASCFRNSTSSRT